MLKVAIGSLGWGEVYGNDKSAFLVMVKDLYKAGLTDFQNVLNTEQAYMRQQDDLSGAEGNIAGYTVQLYKALGGGWSQIEDSTIEKDTDENLKTDKKPDIKK